MPFPLLIATKLLAMHQNHTSTRISRHVKIWHPIGDINRRKPPLPEHHPTEDRLLVYCTCPDEASAQRLAETLVDESLAACVNILPGIQSVYRWQGKRESAQEQLLIIKTLRAAYPQLEKTIVRLHPYELPEIIAVPITLGLENYLAWVGDNVSLRNNES